MYTHSLEFYFSFRDQWGEEPFVIIETLTIIELKAILQTSVHLPVDLDTKAW